MMIHNHIVSGKICFNHGMYSTKDMNGGTKFVAREWISGKISTSLANTKSRTTYLMTPTTILDPTPRRPNQLQLTLQLPTMQINPTNVKPPWTNGSDAKRMLLIKDLRTIQPTPRTKTATPLGQRTNNFLSKEAQPTIATSIDLLNGKLNLLSLSPLKEANSLKGDDWNNSQITFVARDLIHRRQFCKNGSEEIGLDYLLH